MKGIENDPDSIYFGGGPDYGPPMPKPLTIWDRIRFFFDKKAELAYKKAERDYLIWLGKGS